jgi:DNA (cytosine-5)-methyltransferase 1
MTQPTFGSLFAGVGGFDLGFEAAGYTCQFQVEWDKNCRQILDHNWPHVPKWEDVNNVHGADLPPVDIITYGFPCQDLSVAGKRAGLDGDRSGLFFQAIRIIHEMREATNGKYPKIAVAENVPGLLSADKGAAMARCLDTLAEIGALVQEWHILDAQWFGVPQRRRRIFLTSIFDPTTAQRSPQQIFPVAKSGTRDPKESNKTRETTPPTPQHSTTTPSQPTVYVKAKRAQNNTDDESWETNRPNPTLNAFDQGDTRTTTTIVYTPQPIGFSHTQGLDAQPSTQSFPTLRTGGAGHAVAQPIGIHGKNIGRQDKNTSNGAGWTQENDPMYTLTTVDIHAIADEQAQHTQLAVRRLTPLECERLMGWPENHTLHRADGKQNSDSQRYKQCGNGVAAPVAKWVATHLKPLIQI